MGDADDMKGYVWQSQVVYEKSLLYFLLNFVVM